MVTLTEPFKKRTPYRNPTLLNKAPTLIPKPIKALNPSEVMALCGAAHLLCGDHTEALLITEPSALERELRFRL